MKKGTEKSSEKKGLNQAVDFHDRSSGEYFPILSEVCCTPKGVGTGLRPFSIPTHMSCFSEF